MRELREHSTLAEERLFVLEQRVSEAEAGEEQVKQAHVAFAKGVQEELTRRRNTDALAQYLQAFPGGVQVDLDNLEGLIATLSAEVGKQWEEQIGEWQKIAAQKHDGFFFDSDDEDRAGTSLRRRWMTGAKHRLYQKLLRQLLICRKRNWLEYAENEMKLGHCVKM